LQYFGLIIHSFSAVWFLLLMRAHGSCPPPADAREYVEAGNACNNLDLKAPEAAAAWVSLSAAAAILWGFVVVG
jgi:hypothetical protein